MVVLLYMASANTDTLASTSQYTQLNAAPLRSVGYAITLHAKYILDLLNCIVLIAYVAQNETLYNC